MKKKIDICLVVDRSGSLSAVGSMINGALVSTLKKIKEEPYLSGCDVYFTLVSFADDMTKNVDFVPIGNVSESSLNLKYDGQTNPAPALEYTVDKAYQRYYAWKDNGEEVFHPLIFFFTDGAPYPVDKYMPEYKKIAKKIAGLNGEKLLFVCAGYGSANVENLEIATNNKNLVIPMTGDRVDRLAKFFSEIIPKTVTIVSKAGENYINKTKTFDMMADMFKFFTEN